MTDRTFTTGRRGDFFHEGHRLAYEVRGGDGPPFVLLHGLLLPSWFNGHLASAIADHGHRVILFDLLGHGRSDTSVDPTLHRLEFGGDQVVGLLDHLGIDEAVVGGMSLGANVALQTAVAAPDRVRGLVCEMPVVEGGTIPAALTLLPLYLALRYGGPVVRTVFAVARRVPRGRNEVLNAVLDTAGDPEAMAAIMAGYTSGPACPSKALRRRIDAPALVVGHHRDWIHPIDDAETLAEELPNARLVEARSFFEVRLRPERIVGEVVSFLDDAWQDESPAARHA